MSGAAFAMAARGCHGISCLVMMLVGVVVVSHDTAGLPLLMLLGC